MVIFHSYVSHNQMVKGEGHFGVLRVQLSQLRFCHLPTASMTLATGTLKALKAMQTMAS